MKRRDLLIGTAGLAASSQIKAANKETYKWKMVTTWPPNFPGLGTGAMRMAKNIEKASGGRIKIKVFAGGELVPAFESFDFVSSGGAEMGHGAAYYWRGKSEATQIFTTLPFGLNAMELNGWLYYGGGMELYRELYEPFNLRPYPAGNSGCQMGGWFKKAHKLCSRPSGLKDENPRIWWRGFKTERRNPCGNARIRNFYRTPNRHHRCG